MEIHAAARALAAIFAVVALQGCVAIEKVRHEVSAADLAVTPEDLAKAASLPSRKEFLGRVVMDSQQKCNAFLANLTTDQQVINSTGDVATTVFSALASVFKPVTTVRALAGASTISSGSKAALINAYYAKATIAHFSTALQQTYSRSMTQYREGLDDLDESTIILSNEVAKIQSIHYLCGLAQAEATIATTLTSSPPPAGAQGPITVSKSFNPASIAVNGTSVLTITLGNTSGVAAALTAAFVDSFPAGMKIGATPNLGGSCGQAALVTAQAGASSLTLASGASVPAGGCTITVNVTGTSTGSLPNTLGANALKTDKGSNATSAAASLTVSATPPVSAAPVVPIARAARETKGADWGRPLR